jgi:hypothetical protein
MLRELCRIIQGRGVSNKDEKRAAHPVILRPDESGIKMTTGIFVFRA